MTNQKTVAEIVASGVPIGVAEAIAIVQQLVASDAAAAAPGPPAMDNVIVRPDGSVVCGACAIPPVVLDMGLLLQALLPQDGSTRVPGALRYTIARALQTVDAPAFASVAAFSEVLQRFEPNPTDRRVVLQQLYARADATATVVRAGPKAERRRPRITVADLRRQLREADEEQYALRGHRVMAPTTAPLEMSPLPVRDSNTLRELDVRRAAPEATSPRSDGWRWGVHGTAALLVSFGLGYAAVADRPSASGDALRSASGDPVPTMGVSPALPCAANGAGDAPSRDASRRP